MSGELAAESPTALYRFFGESGILLYVGVTKTPTVRWNSHERTKPGWTEVHRVDLEWFTNRSLALAAEAEAIRSEAPLWNIARPGETAEPIDGPGRGRWQPRTGQHAQALAEIAVAVAAHKAAVKRTWEAAQQCSELGVPKTHIAKATGISLATVNRHIGPTRNGSGPE